MGKIMALAEGIGVDTVCGHAVTGSLKEGEGELLEDDTNVKIYESGAWDINANSFDWEPEEEILGRDAGKSTNLSIAENPRNVPIIMHFVLELGYASHFQMYLKSSITV